MDRILAFDSQTLIQMGIILFNVLLLCFILYKVMYAPVQNFLASRALRVANQLAEAETKMQSAEEMKALYAEKLESIENERSDILAAAYKKARDNEAVILQKAKVEAGAIHNRSMLDIEREREKVENDMKVEIVQVSALMASRFVANVMDANTQSQLFDQAITELEEAKWLIE